MLATIALLAAVPDARTRGSRGLLRRPQHLARTLAYLAHYSDADQRRSLGYQPPAALAPGWADIGTDTEAPLPARVDACVVGAGAAGAIIAEHLARSGRSVVLVEQGAHHRFPSDPDELAVLGSVYRDGALQLSRDKGLSVLQANGLGGSTMVNNGNCTYPGDPALSQARGNVLRLWRAEGAEIDLDAFQQARESVERRLSVGELPASAMGRNATLLLARGRRTTVKRRPRESSAPTWSAAWVAGFATTAVLTAGGRRSWTPTSSRASATGCVS